jgi:hypothetical protein
MSDEWPGLAAKNARLLAVKPEYFVTQPAELRIVRGMSEADLQREAMERGWRIVSRVGGRQVEFYNDAAVQTLT